MRQKSRQAVGALGIRQSNQGMHSRQTKLQPRSYIVRRQALPLFLAAHIPVETGSENRHP